MRYKRESVYPGRIVSQLKFCNNSKYSTVIGIDPYLQVVKSREEQSTQSAENARRFGLAEEGGDDEGEHDHGQAVLEHE